MAKRWVTVPWLGAVLALAPAAAAVAAPQWLVPVGVSAPGSNAVTALAMNAAGDAVAVWQSLEWPGGVQAQSVWAATRSAGQAFSSPVRVYGPARQIAQASPAPVGAVSAAGDAVVAWARDTAQGRVVQAAVRPAGSSSFSAAVDVSSATGQALNPSVATDASGDVIVAWAMSVGAGKSVVQAAVRPAGGVFSPPVDVSASDLNVSMPAVAMGQGGDAVVAWTAYNGTSTVAQAAVRPAGGSFSAPITISSPAPYGSPASVAMDRAGDAIVVWERSDDVNQVVSASVRPAGGAFSAPVDVSAVMPRDSLGVSVPAVAMSDGGAAVVAWRRTDAGGGVQASTRPAGGAFSAPVLVSAPTQDVATSIPSAPSVAMDAVGDAVVAWDRRPAVGESRVAQAAVRPAGGAFSAPQDISLTGGDALATQVAMDALGDAVAVFGRAAGFNSAGNTVVQAAVYDATAPVLSTVSVPATATAGVPVAMSASASDAWSGVAMAFDFGDHATERAGAVTHAYSDAGTYTVTVTATDGAGNAATAQRTITVAPAPVPVLSKLSLSPRAFRAGRRPGARLTYSLDRAGDVLFTVQRLLAGRRVSGRCVKATGANRRHAVCTRAVRVGGRSRRAGSAGVNQVRFNARLGGTLLGPGSYKLVATPVSSGRQGAPSAVRFRILARRPR
jgi:hypothetical protein